MSEIAALVEIFGFTLRIATPVLLPLLLVLQVVLWAVLPYRWFPWAVLVVFLAHWGRFAYGLWEIRLPFCGEASAGANCIDPSGAIFPPEFGLFIIAVSATLLALLFLPFVGLRWLMRPRST